MNMFKEQNVKGVPYSLAAYISRKDKNKVDFDEFNK